MMKLPDEVLPPAVQLALDEARSKLEATGDYVARVNAVDQHWKSARRSVIHPVRDTLRSMCGEAEPCCYCEDSVGVQVEHIWPKSLYPEKTFDWLNLLLACGRCNNTKNAAFALWIDGICAPVARQRKAPIVRPPSGQMMFLDLRQEDPLDYFELDFDTGAVVERPTLEPLARERAEYTRKKLKLNDEPFPTRRCHAYGTFRARLKEYANESGQKASRRAEILRLPQQMVWREMQRQHVSMPELADLFKRVPEALGW
jgi:uncharacterized protein (TIGR02646 family)